MRMLKQLVGFAVLLIPTAHVCLSAEAGFVPIFNGKDLSGWMMGPAKSWVVENGVIALKHAKYDTKEHNSDYLWWRQPLGNFVVELEFKTETKANSGIYLRTSNPKNPVPTGIEVQVINSYGETKLHDRSTCGAIYDCLAPSKNTVKPPGQWNQYRITCLNNKISVVLNGEQIIDMDLNKWTEPHLNPDGSKNKFSPAMKDFARKGFFGLQDHGLPVWFRNIRLKKLD